jgi:hypothetical protein
VGEVGKGGRSRYPRPQQKESQKNNYPLSYPSSVVKSDEDVYRESSGYNINVIKKKNKAGFNIYIMWILGLVRIFVTTPLTFVSYSKPVIGLGQDLIIFRFLRYLSLVTQ